MPQFINNLWKKIKMPLLVLSAIIPLLGLLKSPQDTLLPIYSIFVFLLVGKNIFKKNGEGLPDHGFPIRFGLLVFACGMIAEVLAWGVGFLKHAENPALFHPQLVYDLLIGISQYGAWAIVWYFWSKRYSFSVSKVFLLQGIYGVLLEQKGAILIQGLLQMPTGIVLWLYVFAVYGSMPAIAYLLSGGTAERGEKPKLISYILILLSLLAASLSFMITWGLFLQILGIIPKPQPIWLHPLW